MAATLNSVMDNKDVNMDITWNLSKENPVFCRRSYNSTILTDVEGPRCLLAFKLEQEEAAGLVVMPEPQGHS